METETTNTEEIEGTEAEPTAVVRVDAGIDAPEFVPLRGERIRRELRVQVRRNRTSGAETENRTSVIINTLDEDRHGTIIDPAGCRMDAYRQNPVVLINHNHDLLAARSSLQVQNGQIVASINDDDWDHDDPEVERWFRKLKRGLLSMASVGAIVHDYVVELIDPEGDAEDWDNRRIRITDWELVEWSFVSVGSNPAALVTERMMDREGRRFAAAPTSAPPEGDPEPEPEALFEFEDGEREADASESAEPERPVTRAATPTEYVAVVRGLLPVIRSEIQRLTGKR